MIKLTSSILSSIFIVYFIHIIWHQKGFPIFGEGFIHFLVLISLIPFLIFILFTYTKVIGAEITSYKTKKWVSIICFWIILFMVMLFVCELYFYPEKIWSVQVTGNFLSEATYSFIPASFLAKLGLFIVLLIYVLININYRPFFRITGFSFYLILILLFIFANNIPKPALILG